MKGGDTVESAANSKLHSNTAYNIFQTGVTALVVFTGGMKATMKCFIAGTLIATETGFARIEDVKPGDIVLSTNTDTMETGCKKVLEKYVRKTRELVHIIVGGKKIVSTPDHPYYVEGRGFVNACQLCIGSPLLDADGKILEIEQIYKEQLGKNEEVTVYNFQVEDWHTYHVGEMEVLVHNAEYESGLNSNLLDELANSGVKYNPEDIVAITKTADGKLVWLENGIDTAGLNHIITEHADDFLNKGITQEQIPDYVMNALENGKIVGYQGRGTGRPIYEFTYNGEIHKVAITVGNNGFIVGANPK